MCTHWPALIRDRHVDGGDGGCGDGAKDSQQPPQSAKSSAGWGGKTPEGIGMFRGRIPPRPRPLLRTNQIAKIDSESAIQ